MPVPLRDTPRGRELLEEGREEGLRAVHGLTRALLRRAFGDDPRIDSAADVLVDLPDDERLARITAATRLEDLLF